MQGSDTNFPTKLFSALECDQFKASIAWNAEGNAWKILNLADFSVTALQRFTGGTTRAHFDAFVHLLNVWGFQQIKVGTHAAAFHHEQFRRDNAVLLKSMVPKSDVLTYLDASTIIIGDDSQKNIPAHSHQDDDIVASIERCLNSQTLSNKCAGADEILSFPGHGGHEDPSTANHKDPTSESRPQATIKEGTTTKSQVDLPKHGSALLRSLGHTTPGSSAATNPE